MITGRKDEKEAKKTERAERVYQKPTSEAAEACLGRQDDGYPIELERSEECQHVGEVCRQHHGEVGVDIRADLIEADDNLRARRWGVSSQQRPHGLDWMHRAHLQLGPPAEAFEVAGQEAQGGRNPRTQPVESRLRMAAQSTGDANDREWQQRAQQHGDQAAGGYRVAVVAARILLVKVAHAVGRRAAYLASWTAVASLAVAVPVGASVRAATARAPVSSRFA
eukprot:7387436-Prymnesium_polylepis.1